MQGSRMAQEAIVMGRINKLDTWEEWMMEDSIKIIQKERG